MTSLRWKSETMKHERMNLMCACILAVSIIALLAAPAAVHAEKKTLRSQGVVLLEDFTNVMASQCGYVDPILDQVARDYGTSQLAVIRYHVNGGGYTDPFKTTEGTNRAGSYYGISGLPYCVVDGQWSLLGMTKMTYENYSGLVNAGLSVDRPADISITGEIASGSVIVHIEKAASTIYSNLKVRYAVVESGIHYAYGASNDSTYDQVVREMPTEDTLDFATLPKEITKTFSIGSDWNKTNLGFVAFIQSDTNAIVLQACYYGYAGVPEMSVLAVVPIGGIFVALAAMAWRGKRR